MRPANGRLTSKFGWRWGRMHNGIDIAAAKGTPIVAAADGVVTQSTVMSGYGNTIVISHGNGYSTLYAHLNSRNVSAGTKVRKGQVIATMGNTGSVVAGPGGDGTHLHFEVRRNGAPVDPLEHIN